MKKLWVAIILLAALSCTVSIITVKKNRDEVYIKASEETQVDSVDTNLDIDDRRKKKTP